MGFFKRRKDKKNLEKVLADVQAPEQRLEQLGGGNEAEEKLLERCDRMMENAREIEDGKKEYHVITSYLNDIEIIENLPPDKEEEMKRAADYVAKLNQARDDFLNTSKRMSDAQFQMFQRLEDEIPDIVKNLRDNENYQSTVKRDMQYLEGEKQEWEIQKQERRRQRRALEKGSVFLLFAVATVAVLLIVLSVGFQMDMRYAWIVTIAVAVLAAALIVFQLENGKRDIRQADVNINYAITLLNKVKIKYVNITNAVDYTREKYHVRDARELASQWEMYQEAVREQEKYRKTNEDLNYYYDKLVRLLKSCELYDSRVWIEQPQALVEPKEMVEIKHDLLVRRQKLRSRIAYNLDVVKKGRAEMDALLKGSTGHSVGLMEMLASIDQMAGLERG